MRRFHFSLEFQFQFPFPIVEDHEEDESPIQAIEPNRCLSFGFERKATLRGEDSGARARKQSVSGQCFQFSHQFNVVCLFVSSIQFKRIRSVFIYKASLVTPKT